MIGARIPYLQRDAGDSGNNTGIGDVSTSLWKSLVSGKGSQPSLVASLQYIAPTGEDAGDADVPLGVGFRQLTARVSALETIAPVALFGDLYYTHYISETISGINLNRDGAIGFGLGASLAVRPDVSLTGGVDFTFEDELELDGVTLDGTDTVLGRLELGVGVLLSRYVFLNVFGTFGITDDSPDLTVGMALPIRF